MRARRAPGRSWGSWAGLGWERLDSSRGEAGGAQPYAWVGRGERPATRSNRKLSPSFEHTCLDYPIPISIYLDSRAQWHTSTSSPSPFPPPPTSLTHPHTTHADPHRRTLDPIFALSIGLAAAATRINREEKEKGRTTGQTVDVAKRRVGLWWNGAADK